MSPKKPTVKSKTDDKAPDKEDEERTSDAKEPPGNSAIAPVSSILPDYMLGGLLTADLVL